MEIFIEIMSVFWQAFWGVLNVIGTIIWQNLPELLELKKIMSYFTPTGMIALYLGVPAIVITALLWVLKKVTRSI